MDMECRNVAKYRFVIQARLRGALGVWNTHTVTVEAADKDAARLKLYDTHEHISVLTCVEVADDA